MLLTTSQWYVVKRKSIFFAVLLKLNFGVPGRSTSQGNDINYRRLGTENWAEFSRGGPLLHLQPPPSHTTVAGFDSSDHTIFQARIQLPTHKPVLIKQREG